MNLLFILVGILVFGVLVLLHELGHFTVSRLFGVPVGEFGIGMGPLLWQKEHKGTIYSLRAIPMGGFCAFYDEEEEDPRNFRSQKSWKKALILLAGSGVNFLTGFVVVALLFTSAAGFLTDKVVGFAPEFPSQGEQGLMEGDLFYRVDGYRTYLRGDASTYLAYHEGDTIDLEVLRDGEVVVLEDLYLPRQTYTDMSGGTYTGYGLYIGAEVEEATFTSWLKYSWRTSMSFVQLVRFSLAQIISGGASVEDISGPVGMISTMTELGTEAETTRAGLENVLYFAAMLAVNLAVMNLLPLPALDGGQLVFLLLDEVGMLLFKRKIPAKYQGAINGVCLALLLAFVCLITVQDVTKLF